MGKVWCLLWRCCTVLVHCRQKLMLSAHSQTFSWLFQLSTEALQCLDIKYHSHSQPQPQPAAGRAAIQFYVHSIVAIKSKGRRKLLLANSWTVDDFYFPRFPTASVAARAAVNLFLPRIRDDCWILIWQRCRVERGKIIGFNISSIWWLEIVEWRVVRWH